MPPPPTTNSITHLSVTITKTINCFVQELNKMTAIQTQTQTALPEDKHPNCEATTPPSDSVKQKNKLNQFFFHFYLPTAIYELLQLERR